MENKGAFNLKIKGKEIKLTTEDIDDIMVSVLEGGINYWCSKAEVIEDTYYGEYASEQISRGGSLRLHDDVSAEKHTLNLGLFIKGFQKYLEQGNMESIENGRVNAGNIDAIAADCIVQYALFGKLEYS